jgi:hypothetical protein
LNTTSENDTGGRLVKKLYRAIFPELRVAPSPPPLVALFFGFFFLFALGKCLTTGKWASSSNETAEKVSF